MIKVDVGLFFWMARLMYDRLCVFLIWMAFGLMGAQDAFAQTPIVIKFSHVVTADTPKGKAAEYFKQLAQERTRGRVRVDIYPNSQLYRDKDELAALQLGSVQMLAPSLAKLGSLGVRDFELFDLPFLFNNYEDLHRITYGEIGQRLLKKLEIRGLIGLAYWDNGFKQMSATTPLLKTIDFNRLKMRIQSSWVIDAQMRALGAQPKMIDFVDTYQALKQKNVDGTESPLSNMLTQQMYEVQPYITVSNHGYLGYAVIVNQRFWEDLPKDIRQTLEGAIKDTTKYVNGIAHQENEIALNKLKAMPNVRVYALTDADRLAWRNKLKQVHIEMQHKIGKPLMQEIYQTLNIDLSQW